MATITLQQMRYVGNMIDNAPRKFVGGAEEPQFKEAASQSWSKGEFLYFSSGKLAEITSFGNGQKIAAQAMEAATGTTDAQVYCAAIRETDLFEANVYHSTVGSAVTALTQLGGHYRLTVQSGKVHVDIENTTLEDGTNVYPRVRVVKILDAVGDTYGRVICHFVDKAVATDGSPQANFLELGA